MSGLFIGIDLGTTGIKASIFDAQGTCFGEAYNEYGLITLSPVMIEQDPQTWWELTCQAIRQVLQSSGVDRKTVRAMAVSSQGISFVLIDRDGNPLENAISWLDGRPVDETKQILERYSAERLFSNTGKRSAPYYVLPKLLWLKKNKPEIWRQTQRVLMGHDYLVFRLCGGCITDRSMAGGTLVYNLHTLDWWDEILEEFNLSRHLLPELRWAGETAGKLRPEVAESLGLSLDTVVVVGGQDQKCAALGAGISDGTATVSLGTATAITQVMDRPLTDPGMRVPTFSFVQEGRWALEGVVGTGAGSLRWYRNTIAPGMSYDDVVAEAEGIAPGAEGVMFFPHLSGATSPHWDNDTYGLFSGLSLATTRGHLTRAVLEGIAFQVRENLDVMGQVMGSIDRLILFGGGAKSVLWRAIIGDVVGCPVCWTPSSETASLGAAMLAAAGCGEFSNLGKARDAMVRMQQQRSPDAVVSAIYQTRYAVYKEVENRILEKR